MFSHLPPLLRNMHLLELYMETFFSGVERGGGFWEKYTGYTAWEEHHETYVWLTLPQNPQREEWGFLMFWCGICSRIGMSRGANNRRFKRKEYRTRIQWWRESVSDVAEEPPIASRGVECCQLKTTKAGSSSECVFVTITTGIYLCHTCRDAAV